MQPIWEPECECLDREAMSRLQLKRLQSAAARAYDRVPFYRKRFDEHGVKPQDVRALSDLAKLPIGW